MIEKEPIMPQKGVNLLERNQEDVPKDEHCSA